MRTVGRGAHRVAPGEVAVRPGGVLPHAVSQSADPVRQAAAPVAVAAHGQLASDRAAVLRAAGGQDAHRDAHPGHAPERQQLQLAVHQLHVTLRLEADDRHACLVVITARGRHRATGHQRSSPPSSQQHITPPPLLPCIVVMTISLLNNDVMSFCHRVPRCTSDRFRNLGGSRSRNLDFQKRSCEPCTNSNACIIHTTKRT